jgi:hypothetical protein
MDEGEEEEGDWAQDIPGTSEVLTEAEPDLSKEQQAIARASLQVGRMLQGDRSWINRRVETVEMLSHEQTRRRVSVDFTLSDSQRDNLSLPWGTIVPIATLEKAPLKDFDVWDESGSTVPVLGELQNATLAHGALLVTALDVLDSAGISPEFSEVETLSDDLAAITLEGDPELALQSLGHLRRVSEIGTDLRSVAWRDEGFQRLAAELAVNYVLFVVLDEGTPLRRVIKFGYSEEQVLRIHLPFRTRFSKSMLRYKALNPTRETYVIECPAAGSVDSFHLEIAIPAELRICEATFFDRSAGITFGMLESNVNRGALHLTRLDDPQMDVVALAEIAPERKGEAGSPGH